MSPRSRTGMLVIFSSWLVPWPDTCLISFSKFLSALSFLAFLMYLLWSCGCLPPGKMACSFFPSARMTFSGVFTSRLQEEVSRSETLEKLAFWLSSKDTISKDSNFQSSWGFRNHSCSYSSCRQNLGGRNSVRLLKSCNPVVHIVHILLPMSADVGDHINWWHTNDSWTREGSLHCPLVLVTTDVSLSGWDARGKPGGSVLRQNSRYTSTS